MNVTGGTQRLSGATANGTGPVNVSGGLLQLNKTAGVDAIGTTTSTAITVAASLTISGYGTVQLLQSQQIDPAVPVTLAGGKLLLSGHSQTFNTPLAITASTTIDFGAGQPIGRQTILRFADSSARTWSGSTDIFNWVGQTSGAGQDMFCVGTTNDMGAQLFDLWFINPTANGVVYTGTFPTMQLSSGEIVPLGCEMWWPHAQWTNSAGGGSWNTGGNWSGGSVLSVQGAVATFTATGAGTVTLDAAQTVGQIIFNSSASYTIVAGSGGSLTIDDNYGDPGSLPSINVTAGSHSITAPIHLVNGLTLNVAPSTALSLGGAITGMPNITATGGGTVNLASGILPATTNLAINSATTVALSAAAAGSQSLASLSIDATSMLDVGKQTVTVPDAGAPGSTCSAILSRIMNGYVNKLGNGITSPLADSAHGVGIIDDGASVTFGYTLLGDANMDGKVDFSDLVALDQSYNTTGADWAQGDFDYAGSTDFTDLVYLAQNYNLTVTAAQSPQLDAISPSFAADWALARSKPKAFPSRHPSACSPLLASPPCEGGIATWGAMPRRRPWSGPFTSFRPGHPCRNSRYSQILTRRQCVRYTMASFRPLISVITPVITATYANSAAALAPQKCSVV